MPKPEYWRNVHSLPRYPLAKLPRVKGTCPAQAGHRLDRLSVDGLERDAGGGLYWLGHQWITYLQKMRMPIPHTGNMHHEKPARALS